MPIPPAINPITSELFQTFSRLPWTDHTNPGGQQAVISDLYNKIAAVQAGSQTVNSNIPTPAAIQQQISAAITSATSAGSPTSVIPKALNALIPIELQHPTSTGDKFAIDTAVVIWNPGGSDTILYQYSAANTAWAYIAGTVQRTQANLATLAGLLGAADTGLLVDVTDFAHILVWTGTAWTYADPTDPAGRVEMFLVDPNPTIGWQLMDGTANVKYLKADGTTGTITVPDLTSAANKAAYPKMGSPANATPNAAVAPNFTGTPQTFTTQAAQATGTVNAFVSPNPYTPAGTIDTAGEPRNLIMRPWLRV